MAFFQSLSITITRPIMTRTALTLCLLIIMLHFALAEGFGVAPLLQSIHGHGHGVSTHFVPFAFKNTLDDRHITFEPMIGNKPADMARAKACIEHSGQCSVEEMEELRDHLHQERMQRFMLGNALALSSSATRTRPILMLRELEDDTLEHRWLEEELELQLSHLHKNSNDHTSKSSSHISDSDHRLFPEIIEESMLELPHLQENPTSHHQQHHPEKEGATDLAFALDNTGSAVLEESNLEAIALCCGILIVLLFPHLLHV